MVTYDTLGIYPGAISIRKGSVIPASFHGDAVPSSKGATASSTAAVRYVA